MVKSLAEETITKIENLPTRTTEIQEVLKIKRVDPKGIWTEGHEAYNFPEKPVKEFLDFYVEAREAFFVNVTHWFQHTATYFGFPENRGMLIYQEGLNSYYWNRDVARNLLPVRDVQFPPQTHPNNYLEILIGDMPKVSPLDRYFYEGNDYGFFSYYIDNFKNVIFLPNDVSEFIQINLNYCLDIQFLEVCREMGFVVLIVYFYMISFRVMIAWLITINPYTFPLAYFIALVDWIEDISMGILPVIGGVSLGTPLLMSFVGKVADGLNHLIFTMPYLPSEGVIEKVMIEGEVRNYLSYRYLPVLWYKHPIPNEIREYWYTERPDILKYLEESYSKLDIRFLPDRIVGLNSEFLFKTDELIIGSTLSLPHLDNNLIRNCEIISEKLIHLHI